MLRYINDQFNDKHLSTLQAAFMKKKLKVGNNSVELAIWVSLASFAVQPPWPPLLFFSYLSKSYRY